MKDTGLGIFYQGFEGFKGFLVCLSKSFVVDKDERVVL